MKNTIKTSPGFSLLELVMVIVLLSVLTAVAVIKWPTGMNEDAAVFEFRRAARFAQHQAMTKRYSTAGSYWGIIVSGNQYTIWDGAGTAAIDPGGGIYPRSLPDDLSITSVAGSVWFNGLGEPIDTLTGVPLATPTTFNINNNSIVTVYQETGYAE